MDIDIVSATDEVILAEVTVVAVSGSVDVHTADRLRSALDGLIGQQHLRIVVDLRRVDFLDSSGLGVLVGRLKAVQRLGGWLRLVVASDRILRVLTITGLDQVFVIADSPQALAALPPDAAPRAGEPPIG